MKQRQNTFATTGVATASMWNGDLSNITDTSGGGARLYDPQSTGANGIRTPFQNNVIPSSRLSPYAKISQGVSPTPNTNLGGNPWTDLNFQAYYPITQDQHSLTIKIDHNFSEKDTISGRFTNSPFSGAQYGGKYGFPPPGCTNCGGTARQDYGVYSDYLRWNHVFSPTFLNELQVSNHRSTANYGTLGDSTKWADKLGLPNPFGVTGWPTVYTDAYNLYYGGGWDGDNRNVQNLTAFEVSDGVTWIKGKHTIKAGFKGRQDQQRQPASTGAGVPQFLRQFEGSLRSGGKAQRLSPDPDSPNCYSAYQRRSGINTTGASSISNKKKSACMSTIRGRWAPLYRRRRTSLGSLHSLPRKVQSARQSRPHQLRQQFSGKIIPGSTTIDSLPNIPSGVLASWQARGLSWVTANYLKGFPSALVPSTWGDFGPRLAAAYQISNKWVVQPGYGMYYWPTPLSQILAASRTNPPLNLNFVNHLDTANGTFFNHTYHRPHVRRLSSQRYGERHQHSRHQLYFSNHVHHGPSQLE